RDDDRYGRNDGRYGNIGPTISNLKYKAKALEDTLDRDRYDRNGSNLEGLSDRFKNAVDDLYKEYQDRDGGYDEVQRVLNIGEQLDREISRNRVGRGVRNDWNSIERDLRTLANAYNVSYRGNNGAGWKISDIFRNFPF
ncbi:MAG: glycerol-3-phosphate dehydrogenase/oxidase, partial [Acidobacteriota bacterium]|nr:glycerol-3-phosphate dehydrogenase/oxidase [Acidobacteriota bacterium]